MLYTDDRRGVRLRCRRVYVSVYVQNDTGGFLPFLWLRKFTVDHITKFKTIDHNHYKNISSYLKVLWHCRPKTLCFLSVFKYESKSADILELYLSTFDQWNEGYFVDLLHENFNRYTLALQDVNYCNFFTNYDHFWSLHTNAVF